ncbi:MAG: GHKL domain-containing protein [bacterium]|nr:GHKL domain-containing protein [bacterium]
MGKILKLFVFIAFMLSAHHTYSQTLPLCSYSLDDGLVSPLVNCIYQDKQGYIWFGTQHGLSRFNGLDFHNFEKKNGLPGDYIIEIFQDSKDRIWIGTSKGGVGCYHIHTDEFKNYNSENGLPANRVHTIIEDNHNNIWFGTHSGICRMEGDGFITFTMPDGLPDNRIRDIVMDNKGIIWIATARGLCLYDGKTFSKRPLGRTPQENTINVLTADNQNNIWIGTNGGLFRVNGDTPTFFSTHEGLPHNTVNAITRDRLGNIWIGTDDGLSVFDGKTFVNYNSSNGLPNNKILATYQDREGNMWFGTRMGAGRLMSREIVNFTVKNGITNNLVWSFEEDAANNIWIGTDRGLNCWSGGKFINNAAVRELADKSIYALYRDSDNNTWIGSTGLYRLGADMRLTDYTPRADAPEKLVFSFAQDKRGVLWIGSSHGLYQYQNGTFSQYKQHFNQVQTMVTDREGNVWFSEVNGLNKLSGESLTHYSTENGLPQNFIFCLHEDSRGRMWVGTSLGAGYFKNGRFTNYTTDDGLSDNVCYLILEDDQKNIWIGTKKGLNRFDGKTFKIYTVRNGLASSGVEQKSCLRDSSGFLWFGTSNGAIRLDPRASRKNTVPPPIYLTQFKVFEDVLPLEEYFILKHNRNFIRLGYQGLSFTSPRDVQYKYRLKKIHHNWLTTAERSVSYPYLPPGEYIFEVKAVNNDGVMSGKPAELRFAILSPYWKTWWFQLFMILIFFSLLTMVFLWRNRRVKEKAVLEEKNKQLVMAQKMELLGVLAGGAVHDLKNLLTIIINYSGMAARDIDDGVRKKSNEKIRKAASSAIQLAKQIMAFTRRGSAEMRAANLPDLLNDIIDILKITVSKNAEVRLDNSEPRLRFKINPTHFQQVVMNLCINAVHAMPEEGVLRISLRKEGEQAVLEISDTGTGIDEKVKAQIFEPLFTTKEVGKGTGLGLFVVKQIIDQYKGKISVQSELGVGTTFKITLPLEKM